MLQSSFRDVHQTFYNKIKQEFSYCQDASFVTEPSQVRKSSIISTQQSSRDFSPLNCKAFTNSREPTAPLRRQFAEHGFGRRGRESRQTHANQSIQNSSVAGSIVRLQTEPVAEDKSSTRPLGKNSVLKQFQKNVNNALRVKQQEEELIRQYLPTCYKFFQILEQNERQESQDGASNFHIDGYYIDHVMKQHHIKERLREKYRVKEIKSKFLPLIERSLLREEPAEPVAEKRAKQHKQQMFPVFEVALTTQQRFHKERVERWETEAEKLEGESLKTSPFTKNLFRRKYTIQQNKKINFDF